MAHNEQEQTKFGAPPPDQELRRLDPLVGTWRAEDHTLDGVFGPGVPVRSEETFAWLDGGYYLVQTYETVFGDEPAQKGVNYWFYDSVRRRFHIIFFSNNGPYSRAGSEYDGGVEGGKLTMGGPARFQYDMDEDGKIRTNADGSISIAWWAQDDKREWQPWMNNTFRRISEKA
jgi:hypothetical protein